MKLLLILGILFTTQYTLAQTITGTLSQQAGQNISLSGFADYDNQELSSTIIDRLGNFRLSYPKNYIGMAVLKTQDKTLLVLVLDQKPIELKGTHLKDIDQLKFTKSTQNQHFVDIGKRSVLNNKAALAWHYLNSLYAKNTYLSQKKVHQTIKKELQRLKNDSKFSVAQLPENTYLKWFAPLQELVMEMPRRAKNNPQRIPENRDQFRTIDFTHPNFKTSGLLQPLIEGHYKLLENSGQTAAHIASQMNISTDYLICNLQENDTLLNKVATQLFRFLEKRSLFTAAAHLSKVLVAAHPEVLTAALRSKMERYVRLKIGNTAPDIQLTKTKKLSHYQQPVLLVFGASSCANCKEEALELVTYYDTWHLEANLEVVYISVDTDKKACNAFYKNAPWQTFCSFKGLETQAVKDYFVNATPTYILLDKQQKIRAHPKNLPHVNALLKQQL
tara:strand:+ start:2826 stop:4163 length:1338 start_codon:yes stop_codon:yes gene_type:complete